VQAVKDHNNLLPLGVEMLVFADITPATEANCMQYAQQMGVDPARMVVDQNHQVLFTKLDAGGTEIGMPWECALDAQGMTYYWNWTQGGDVLGAIDELLQVDEAMPPPDEIPEVPAEG